MAELHTTRLMNDVTHTYTSSQGRRFALTLAGAFGLLAMIAYWRGRESVFTVLGSLALIFLVAGVIVPSLMQPVERAWMAFAHAISRVTTPLFMGIVYFVVLTPIGAFRRAIDRNALEHKKIDGSYWIRRDALDPAARRRRMERQF